MSKRQYESLLFRLPKRIDFVDILIKLFPEDLINKILLFLKLSVNFLPSEKNAGVHCDGVSITSREGRENVFRLFGGT